MFNLLPNVQNPACQGGLTAFSCIHESPLATCVKCHHSIFLAAIWPCNNNTIKKVRGHVLYKCWFCLNLPPFCLYIHQGSRIFLKTYLPRASEDRKFTCPPMKFTFPMKVGRKLIFNIIYYVYLTWRLFNLLKWDWSFLSGNNASSCREKERLMPKKINVEFPLT